MGGGTPSRPEAATGMGLPRLQVLVRVELPLAVPAIIGGLRIAVVSTIAIGTIAGIEVTTKGLGYPIFNALQDPTPFKTEIYSAGNLTFKTGILIAGSLAILIAILFDFALVTFQRFATPWQRVEAR